MQMPAETLDRARLEEHFAAQKAALMLHPFRFVLGHFGRWLLAGYILAWLPLFLARDRLVFPLSGSALMRYVFAPFVFAALVSVWSVWYSRRRFRLEASALADQVQREHAQLAGPAWIKAALAFGMKLILWVGVPVGALFAVALPGIASLSQRLAILGLFIALTAAWGIPFGFVIRWMTLRSHRRWLIH
jgi:ABC-type uncharacterized transport system permease subunit